MPLPIAHSAFGLAGYYSFKNTLDVSTKQELFLLLFCLLLANLPDIDFIPGFLLKEPGRFHHAASHSILLALSVALIFYITISSRLNTITNKRIFASCSFSLLSHPILDYFSLDTSPPFGVPLLWPFYGEYYTFSFPLFLNVRRLDDSVANFFPSLLNMNNLWGAFIESLFAGTILFALFGFKTRYRPVRSYSCLLAAISCGVLYYTLHLRSYLM